MLNLTVFPKQQLLMVHVLLKVWIMVYTVDVTHGALETVGTYEFTKTSSSELYLTVTSKGTRKYDVTVQMTSDKFLPYDEISIPN